MPARNSRVMMGEHIWVDFKCGERRCDHCSAVCEAAAECGNGVGVPGCLKHRLCVDFMHGMTGTVADSPIRTRELKISQNR